MVEGNRQAIPCVRQNDSFVRRNQVQVNGFVESIARGDNQVAAIRAKLNIGQYFLQANPGPPSGANQVRPDPPGDAREGDVLVLRLIITLYVVQSQQERVVYESRDRQGPGSDVYHRWLRV